MKYKIKPITKEVFIKRGKPFAYPFDELGVNQMFEVPFSERSKVSSAISYFHAINPGKKIITRKIKGTETLSVMRIM